MPEFAVPYSARFNLVVTRRLRVSCRMPRRSSASLDADLLQGTLDSPGPADAAGGAGPRPHHRACDRAPLWTRCSRSSTGRSTLRCTASRTAAGSRRSGQFRQQPKGALLPPDTRGQAATRGAHHSMAGAGRGREPRFEADHGIAMGWRRFTRRAWWDDERTRELQSYLDLETDDNIARGMSPEEVAALLPGGSSGAPGAFAKRSTP